MELKLFLKYYSESLIDTIRLKLGKGLLNISNKLKHYYAKGGI